MNSTVTLALNGYAQGPVMKMATVLVLFFLSLILSSGSANAQCDCKKINGNSAAKAMIKGKSKGLITAFEMLNNTITTNVDGWKVTGFTMSMMIGRNLVSIISASDRLSDEQRNLINQYPVGYKIIIGDVKATDELGNLHSLPCMSFKLQ